MVVGLPGFFRWIWWIWSKSGCFRVSACTAESPNHSCNWAQRSFPLVAKAESNSSPSKRSLLEASSKVYVKIGMGMGSGYIYIYIIRYRIYDIWYIYIYINIYTHINIHPENLLEFTPKKHIFLYTNLLGSTDDRAFWVHPKGMQISANQKNGWKALRLWIRCGNLTKIASMGLVYLPTWMVVF